VSDSRAVSKVLPSDRVTFDSLYGLEIVEEGPEMMRAQVAVSERVLQPLGLVHGGVLASMAEALASIGTGLAVFDAGGTAVGMSNHTQFLRPILSGVIHAEARPRHRGRTTWIWDVEITDDAGKLCALSRVTIAVRPATAG
jgi:1,4-dihydroxy-2-naphthoyl-CoA hydrolase